MIASNSSSENTFQRNFGDFSPSSCHISPTVAYHARSTTLYRCLYWALSETVVFSTAQLIEVIHPGVVGIPSVVVSRELPTGAMSMRSALAPSLAIWHYVISHPSRALAIARYLRRQETDPSDYDTQIHFTAAAQPEKVYKRPLPTGLRLHSSDRCGFKRYSRVWG